MLMYVTMSQGPTISINKMAASTSHEHRALHKHLFICPHQDQNDYEKTKKLLPELRV